jgi:hypothetical protein
MPGDTLAARLREMDGMGEENNNEETVKGGEQRPKSRTAD